MHWTQDQVNEYMQKFNKDIKPFHPDTMEASDIKVYNITPIPKPRMTRSDKWKKRPAVVRYFEYKDKIREAGIILPESGYHVTFILPMPDSWPKKKKAMMINQPHQQTPDKDNLEKGLLDCIFDQDCRIWDGRITKRWGYEGKIIINSKAY
jgi:Holliday junction resolvase RusA-like endonuclease